MNTVTHIATKEKISREGERTAHSFLKGKQLIIEFVGPAGSGKTTNCLHFLDLFRKGNLNVYVFRDVKTYLYQQSWYQRLSIYLHTILSNSQNIFCYTILLASNGIYSIDSIYRYLKLCIFNTALRQFMSSREVDVVFLDQWVIQGLWSATIFKARCYDKLQKELKKFYFETAYVLFFDIDEETASERIGSRKTGRSRFDQMDSVKRMEESKKYNQYLYQLYENSDCKNKMTFSTKVSPHKNAETFYYHLKSSTTERNQLP